MRGLLRTSLIPLCAALLCAGLVACKSSERKRSAVPHQPAPQPVYDPCGGYPCDNDMYYIPPNQGYYGDSINLYGND